MKRRIVRTIASILLLTACSRHDENSQLHHVLGETSVSRSQALLPCVDDSRYPLLVDYLRSVAEHIFASNPRTFSDTYAPSRFCFGLSDAAGLNANATPLNGSVLFTRSILNQFQNDAQLTSVMSHELAHITLNHSLQYAPEFRNSTSARALLAEFDQTLQGMNSALERARKLYDSIRTSPGSPAIDVIRSRVSTLIVETSEKKLAGDGNDMRLLYQPKQEEVYIVGSYPDENSDREEVVGA